MSKNYEQFSYYPSEEEIDCWIQSIWELADNAECKAEILNKNGFSHSLGINHNGSEFTYVKFIPEGMDEFYGYWQPSFSGPAPVLIHLPGYGAELTTHPELAAQGYNVLHISPLGYATPERPDEKKKRNGYWPVLPDTVISKAEEGYKKWLVNCILAIRWVMDREEAMKDRLSFFGTSQGGGGALLLGSVFKDRGVRCIAADVPFLTNFPMAAGRGAYVLANEGLNCIDNKEDGWKALGFVDTLSHATRLTCPVLITAGGNDTVCPTETIESLFQLLPANRSYSYFKNLPHRYSREFLQLAAAWFRIYA